MKSLKTTTAFFLCILCLYACGFTPQQNTASNTPPDSTAAHEPMSPAYFRSHLPRPTGYTNDYEGVFTAAEMKSLDSLAAAFEHETSVQFCIVTLDSTRVNKDSLDALSLYIGNKWRVGQKDKDNGVLFCFSKSLKKIRIQNGYGIEKVVSDATTAAILKTFILPKFKEGKYFEGTFNGLLAYCDTLRQRAQTTINPK